MDHVEGDVIEVALVANSVAASKCHFAVAKHIVGKTHTWPKVGIPRLPQTSNGTLWSNENRSVANSGEVDMINSSIVEV